MTRKKTEDQIRYRLHRQIRKGGYKLITKKRTIYVYYKQLDFTKEVLRLRDEFGYAIQTEIEANN